MAFFRHFEPAPFPIIFVGTTPFCLYASDGRSNTTGGC